MNAVLNLMIVLTGATLSETPSVQVGMDERLKQIDSYLREEHKKQGIPGVSAAIVVDNQHVWSNGFGLADVENDVSVTAETVFPIPGISRMITATAVMQLVQEGKITLDGSIRDFVPELPDKGHAISIRHVLANMSGIRPFKNDDEFYNRKSYVALTDTINLFKDDRLVFKPGEAFLISAPAYNMLGLLIERVSTKPLDEYYKEAVFRPAGMSQSCVDRPRVIVLQRARGYGMDKSRTLLNAPLLDPSDRLPGDGILATADDVARFAIALNTGKLLSTDLVKVMMTSNKTNADKDTQYGLGCFVRQEGKYKIVGHGGRHPQATSFLLMFPDQGKAVVVLTNLDRADVQWIALHVAALLIDDFKPDLSRGRVDGE